MTTARREPRTSDILLCYISDRCQFPGTSAQQQLQLLEKIAECAAAGVDYIQLREKDMGARDLEALARKAVAAIPASSRTSLLVNTRPDIALASRAHGVHLPAREISASEARVIWDRAG